MKRITMFAMAVVIAFTSAAQQPTLESGIKLYNYENYESAKKILLPLSVKDPIANYYLGLAYLQTGDVKKANYQFQKYPDDPANISGTARVAFASKDVAKGMQIAKDLAATAKKKEWKPLLYAGEAITYSDGGDVQQAIQWYKDALTKAADDVELHLAMGDTYVKIGGGGGEAMNNYEFITDKNPNNSLVLTRMGDLWYYAHTYNSALEFYQKAITADANNPLPYRELSRAYQRTNNFQKSLDNVRKYISLSDNTITDQVNFVEILYQSKSFCEAVKVATDLMNQQPPADKRTELLGILGFSQSNCGDSIQALQNLRQYFSSQKPKSITPGAYIEYGKLWLKLDNIDSAGYYYTMGINSDTAKDKADIYRQIAEAYRAKKEYCNAGEWYNNLIKSNPETQALDHFWCTVMYYYCKDWKSALAAAERFETKYADQPSSTYWRARVLSNIDSDATTGAAAPYFQKWIDKIGADISKPEKKSDVVRAYEYLMAYYYNAKDKENLKLYMDKLSAISPDDVYLKQIEEAEKTGTPKKESKAAPKKK